MSLALQRFANKCTCCTVASRLIDAISKCDQKLLLSNVGHMRRSLRYQPINWKWSPWSIFFLRNTGTPSCRQPSVFSAWTRCRFSSTWSLDGIFLICLVALRQYVFIVTLTMSSAGAGSPPLEAWRFISFTMLKRFRQFLKGCLSRLSVVCTFLSSYQMLAYTKISPRPCSAYFTRWILVRRLVNHLPSRHLCAIFTMRRLLVPYMGSIKKTKVELGWP